MYPCLIVLTLLSVDEHLNFPSEFLSYNSNGWNAVNFYPKIIHPRYVADTRIKTSLQSIYNLHLRSSGMLRSVVRELVTDVSGQRVDFIFKC